MTQEVRPLVYGSVCSGIEAASAAWLPLGWHCAWTAEIDPFCNSLLTYHYPDTRNHGDFTKITKKKTAPSSIDVLVGGTPCQSFSVAGRRGGLDDVRGNLTIEYLRLLGRLRPRWFVWENVPGMLSIDGGRTFGTVLGEMGQLGYGVAYRVLDAQYFGVPQRRRRVFVVGHLGDWRGPAAVLFERHCLSGHPPPSREAGEAVAGSLANRARGGGGLGTDFDCAGGLQVSLSLNAHGGSGRMDDESETFVAHSLRVDGFDASEDGTGRGTPIVPILEVGARTGKSTDDPRAGIGIGEPGDPMYTLQGGKQHAVAFSSKDHGADARELSPTLRAMTHDKSHANVGGQVAVAFTERTRKGGRSLEAQEEMAYAVRDAQAGGGSKPCVAADYSVRRLTVVEYCRLQGLPDTYCHIERRNSKGELKWRKTTEDEARYLLSHGLRCEKRPRDWYTTAPADGPMYRALGNSFAVPVVRWIGRRIEAVDRILREYGEEKGEEG